MERTRVRRPEEEVRVEAREVTRVVLPTPWRPLRPMMMGGRGGCWLLVEGGAGAAPAAVVVVRDWTRLRMKEVQMGVLSSVKDGTEAGASMVDGAEGLVVKVRRRGSEGGKGGGGGGDRGGIRLVPAGSR